MREKLGTLDAERQAIRGELDEITGAREELRRLASQRDDLLAASYNGLFDKFISHTPEDRREAYRKIGLTVLVDRDGNFTLEGAFVGSGSRRPPSSRRTSPPPR